MADLIAEYGYLAIVIGCFLEGETVLVLGAIAAKLGYLDIGLVILSGISGTFLGDNLFFFLGRWYGDKLLRNWPVWRRRAVVVKKLLKRFDTWFILGFRFIYGIRSVCPFVFGMSRVRPRRFMMLDLAAGTAWAAAIGGASFALGSAVELFLNRLKGYEAVVISGLALTALVLWSAYLVRMRMRTQRFEQIAAGATGENDNGKRARRRS
jgi:membrane protein DedA with SNARE-associated domain